MKVRQCIIYRLSLSISWENKDPPEAVRWKKRVEWLFSSIHSFLATHGFVNCSAVLKYLSAFQKYFFFFWKHRQKNESGKKKGGFLNSTRKRMLNMCPDQYIKIK